MSPFPKNRSVPFLSATAKSWLVALSFGAASLLVHLAVTRQTPLLEKAALIALAFVPLCVGIVELRPLAWAAFAAAGALAWWLTELVGVGPLLYLPSVAIPAMLAWFFGSTLLPGRTPLVESIAVAARPQTPDYLRRYSRRLTVMWTALFTAIATWDAALALFAPHAWWSYCANLANYLVIGATVVGEYLYRRLRFRDYAHPGFAEYLRIVVRTNPRRAPGA
jgi:uncharacterized membrane protein